MSARFLRDVPPGEIAEISVLYKVLGGSRQDILVWMREDLGRVPWECVPEPLRVDRQICLEAVSRDASVWARLAPALQEDGDICTEAVSRDLNIWEHLPPNVQQDVVHGVLCKNISLWHHLSADLKSDRFFVLGALRRNSTLVQLLDGPLVHDKVFLVEAFSACLDVFPMLEAAFGSDCPFRTAAELLEARASLAQSRDVAEFAVAPPVLLHFPDVVRRLAALDIGLRARIPVAMRFNPDVTVPLQRDFGATYVELLQRPALGPDRDASLQSAGGHARARSRSSGLLR